MSQERQLLRTIYKGDQRNVFSLFVTGGGMQFLSWIFTVPGASRNIMNAGVPYSRKALAKLQGEDLPQACTVSTAVQMSAASFRDAATCLLAEDRDFSVFRDTKLFGVGCTAALVSDQAKKGKHRCFISAVGMEGVPTTYSLELKKGLRTRIEEDYVCSRLVINAMADCAGIAPLPMTDYLVISPGSETLEQVQINVENAENGDILDRIYNKEISHAIFIRKPGVDEIGDDLLLNDEFSVVAGLEFPRGTLVFPGSFNPLHRGHIELVVAALKRLGWDPKSQSCPPVVFEISALNADKPPIDREDLLRRMRQFDVLVNGELQRYGLTNVAVCITSKPLFYEKSELFRNCVFVLGADTLVRLVNPKYYAGHVDSNLSTESQSVQSYNNMICSLTNIANAGCKFVVGGRKSGKDFVTGEGVLESPPTSLLPMKLKGMFSMLSQEDFHVDLSSTYLRANPVAPSAINKNVNFREGQRRSFTAAAASSNELKSETRRSLDGLTLDEQIDAAVEDIGGSRHHGYPLTLKQASKTNAKPSLCVLNNMPKEALYKAIASRLNHNTNTLAETTQAIPGNGRSSSVPRNFPTSKTHTSPVAAERGNVSNLTSPDMSPRDDDSGSPLKIQGVSPAAAAKAAANRIRAFRGAGKSLASPVRGEDASEPPRDPTAEKAAAVNAARAAAERIREYRSSTSTHPIPLTHVMGSTNQAAPPVAGNSADAARVAAQRIRDYKTKKQSVTTGGAKNTGVTLNQTLTLGKSIPRDLQSEGSAGNPMGSRSLPSSTVSSPRQMDSHPLGSNSPRVVSRASLTSSQKSGGGAATSNVGNETLPSTKSQIVAEEEDDDANGEDYHDDQHPVLDLEPLGRKPSSMSLNAQEGDVSEFMTY